MSEMLRTILSRSVLPPLLEHLLEFVADVEMVFDRLLAASGDDQDLVAPRGHGLFHAVLNDRLVDQRQHFLRLSFGGGQETRAQSGSGENGFTNFHLHGVFYVFDVFGFRVVRHAVGRAAQL